MNQQNNVWQKSHALDQTEYPAEENSYNNGDAKKQLLLEYIIGKDETKVLNDTAIKTIGDFRMIVLSAIEMYTYEYMLLIKHIMCEMIGDAELCEITGKYIVAVTKITDSEVLVKRLIQIKDFLEEQYMYNINIVYSNIGNISLVHQMYKRLTRKIEYAFYEEKNIFNEDGLVISENSFDFSYNGLENALRYGDVINTEAVIEKFFSFVKQSKPDPKIVKKRCYELYAYIIRCCPLELIEKYISDISILHQINKFKDIEKFITSRAMEIVGENDPHNSKTYSTLIKDTVKIINDNIGNENLSLRWLAGTILFTNVDYLGKLFKKETGKNFSHYVMEKRMELAKTLIVEKDRVYEVAEKVGYGSNSQYFSHVFKKYTGASPLEYRDMQKKSTKKTG